MTASAQIAVYPLRQDHLGPAVTAVQQALAAKGLVVQPGPMSTLVVGESDDIFDALRHAFAAAAETGHVVMTVTVSNACPIPD